MMIQMKQQQSMMIMFGLFMGMVVVGYVKVVEFIATKCLGYYGWDDNNNDCPSRKDHHGVEEEEEEERKRMMGWDEYMLRFLLPKKRVLVAENNNNNRKVVVLDKKTMLFQSPPPLPVAHVAAARGGKGKSVVTQRCMCIFLHTSSV